MGTPLRADPDLVQAINICCSRSLPLLQPIDGSGLAPANPNIGNSTTSSECGSVSGPLFRLLDRRPENKWQRWLVECSAGQRHFRRCRSVAHRFAI